MQIEIKVGDKEIRTAIVEFLQRRGHKVESNAKTIVRVDGETVGSLSVISATIMSDVPDRALDLKQADDKASKNAYRGPTYRG
jgi:hypothetical protein